MYTPYKLTPGPTGKSCLTCKRRHKKCDLRKPICERCSNGGVECLGYEHNDRRGTPIQSEPPRVSRYNKELLGPNCSPPLSHQLSYPTLLGEKEVSSGPQLAAQERNKAGASDAPSEPLLLDLQPRSLGTLVLPRSPTDSCIYDTFPPKCRGLSFQPSQIRSIKAPLNAVTRTLPVVLSTLPAWLLSDSRIPRNILVKPPDIRSMVEYFVFQFERILDVRYFRPKLDTITKLRKESQVRMTSCRVTREVMLLDAKIYESLWNGSTVQLRDQFISWVEDCEKELNAMTHQPSSPAEFQLRLENALEMSFLKSVLLSSSNTYKLLQRATPTFLQMVFSDSTLWPTRHHNPALVSIAHVLASPRYEPAHFVLMDILCAMVHGAPQLVEYNTDIQPFHTDPHPIEWFNGFPAAFQVLLARINACRDQGSSVDDWKVLEQRLASWQPQLRHQTLELESCKSVAWVAVQESWKQTLLTYLYLAVCGVSSDDSRVQSSVRQIFQLMGTIKRQEPPIANVHCFAQYLIAGACTRSEKQRALARTRLSCASETRFWALRGPEFAPVLDHLWHGAASGGRPIKWSDYVHSRETVLPLAM